MVGRAAIVESHRAVRSVRVWRAVAFDRFTGVDMPERCRREARREWGQTIQIRTRVQQSVRSFR